MSRLLLSACALLAVFTVFAVQSGDSDEGRLLELLPEASEMQAEITEGPLFYDAENLYEYINGAAEAFISYDFQRLVHQIYLRLGAEVTVDIYDMGTLTDAFGIYSSERGHGSDFIDVGTEGYRAEGILNFALDRYYVKLAAFAEDGDASAVLLDFAGNVERRIPAERKFPELFSLFPVAGIVPHSQTYVKRSPLGHQFLSPGYLAEYRLGAGVTTVLLSPSADLEESARKLEQLREHLEKVGKVAELEGPGREVFRAEAKYEGTILALRQGRFVVLLVEPPEHCEDFLETLLGSPGLHARE